MNNIKLYITAKSIELKRKKSDHDKPAYIFVTSNDENCKNKQISYFSSKSNWNNFNQWLKWTWRKMGYGHMILEALKKISPVLFLLSTNCYFLMELIWGSFKSQNVKTDGICYLQIRSSRYIQLQCKDETENGQGWNVGLYVFFFQMVYDFSCDITTNKQ